MHIYSQQNIYKCLCCQGTLPIPLKYSENASLSAFAWSLALRGTFCRDSKEPFPCFLHKPGTYSPLTSSSNVPGGQYELFDDSETQSKTEQAETSTKDSKTKVPETSETSEVASGKQILSWREEYDLKLRKDRSLVYQSLSPEFKPLISQTTDDAEAWRILKNHFEPTTRARVIPLLDEFINTRFETGEALGLFLCRVKQGSERLREVGHQLQPLYQGYQMIRSLPAEYQSIVQTIYRWTDAEFQPDKIKGELLLEENRLRLTRKELYTVSSIAFSNEMYRKETGNCYKQDDKLKTRSSKVKRFKNKTSNVKNKQIGPCYFCKSYGHLIANCKHKTAFSNPKTNESSNTEFKVKSAFSELESNLIETSPDSHEANSSDFGQNTSWVFDTAATAHFCSNKSLYYSFETVSNIVR
ncbi:hypothetical protein AVEN_204065-1 [Araneus ventricosus]|uniref:CCHC-type domain-containing protein n=1 Tax=Araneus ventricosus TaxID=182803 RepID=A0A4Y2PCW5_ARAVE|nr:hypothetical protein AVEN_204065-1 [Araneus ventricosus]